MCCSWCGLQINDISGTIVNAALFLLFLFFLFFLFVIKILYPSERSNEEYYHEEQELKWEIERKPSSFYSDFCNRWVSLAGVSLLFCSLVCYRCCCMLLLLLFFVLFLFGCGLRTED